MPQYHPLSVYDIWFFCLIDQSCRLFDGYRIRSGYGYITPDSLTGRIFKVQFLELSIFRDVHKNRTGPSGTGNKKCFCHHFRNFGSFGNLVVPLGYRGGNPDDIRFLKSIRTEQVPRDLAGYTNHGCGIDLGIGQTGYQVGRSRA